MCNKLKLNYMTTTEKLNDLFKTCDHQINVCKSSIFSADDVKRIYNNLLPEILQIIEANTIEIDNIVHLPKIEEQMLTDLQVKIRDRFESRLYHNSDVIDYSSAEFELNYDNRITLNDVQLDVEEILVQLDEAMLESFEEQFNIETNESE